MTLQELRQRWREINDRPQDDRERQRIESEMFWQFHQAVQRQQRGQVVFDNNIELEHTSQAKQGRGMKRR
jgi:hypothetical protein